MKYTWKKITVAAVLLMLTLALLGCACGRTASSTGPENAAFTVVVDAERTEKVLAYFQAHTGYLPTVVTLNEDAVRTTMTQLGDAGEAASRADALKKLAAGATCLLLSDDAWIAEYDALGLSVNNDALKALSDTVRADGFDLLGVSVVQQPKGTEINTDALTALAVWLTGAEAKYLADNPNLLN